MNVTPEIRNMASAVFAANKGGTFQTFKTIKIQMGWKVHPTMEGADQNFFIMPQEVDDEDVTWVRQELGCRMGVYDDDDLVIQFLPSNKVVEKLPMRALEVFCMWMGNPLQDDQIAEFLQILRVRIQNSLGKK